MAGPLCVLQGFSESYEAVTEPAGAVGFTNPHDHAGEFACWLPGVVVVAIAPDLGRDEYLVQQVIHCDARLGVHRYPVVMSMDRVRVAWSGNGVVGPGLSTFYFTTGNAATFVDDVLTFYTAFAAHLPDDVTITVPTTGDSIDEFTGVIAGGWSGGTGGAVTGGSSASFALGSGARVRWETGGVVAGRHVRGSTFLVPLQVGVFTSSGRLGGTPLTTMRNAAAALVTVAAPQMLVWSRPAPGRLGSKHPVTSSTIPDLPTSLRSRRT